MRRNQLDFLAKFNAVSKNAGLTAGFARTALAGEPIDATAMLAQTARAKMLVGAREKLSFDPIHYHRAPGKKGPRSSRRDLSAWGAETPVPKSTTGL